MSNAELAKEMAGVARSQLQWEKDRAAKQDPLIEKVVNQQIESADTNSERSGEQWQIYKDLFQPVEERMVEDANEFDSDERKARMASEAGADVTRAYQGGLESNQRAMERMGVNPNSGRFAAITNETNLAKAKDTAGAMNKARRDTELQGLAMRTGAAQFGRNMPSTGLAADSLALNGGSNAVGNINAGNAAHAAGLNSAAQWFGGAQAGNSSAGNLGLGLYQGQLQGAQMKQDALGGWMELAGTLGSAALMPKLRKGAVIKNFRPYGGGLSRGLRPHGARSGLSSLKRKGYAEGGMIEGPGTGTSDSIPASIEGVQPIRLSNGEAVLNKEAVDLVGEDFVHRVNAGGLAMLKGGMEGSENQGGFTGGLANRRVQ